MRTACSLSIHIGQITRIGMMTRTGAGRPVHVTQDTKCIMVIFPPISAKSTVFCLIHVFYLPPIPPPTDRTKPSKVRTFRQKTPGQHASLLSYLRDFDNRTHSPAKDPCPAWDDFYSTATMQLVGEVLPTAFSHHSAKRPLLHSARDKIPAQDFINSHSISSTLLSSYHQFLRQ